MFRTKPSAPRSGKPAAMRAGVFGFTCVMGVLGSIYLRTHDALSPPRPSLKQQVDELVTVRFSPAEARKIAVLNAVKAADAMPLPRTTLLFGVATERCERLSVDRFKDLKAAIVAYKAMDETALLHIAEAIEQQLADDMARIAVMRSVTEALCASK